jgi:hypothetical protein
MLGLGFGIYFLVVGLYAWQFGNAQPNPWYPADITRWVYTTYMLVGAVFLVGLGGLGLSIRASFSRQIREVDARLGSMVRQSSAETLPPPLTDASPNVRDTVDRDIDELLESLSEVEASATREVQAMDARSSRGGSSYGDEDDTKLGGKRQRLMARRKFLGRYLIGPGVVVAMILGISGMMLPGADGFAQYNHHLNTALILGIGYSWVGVGWYIALTVFALVGGRDSGRRK